MTSHPSDDQSRAVREHFKTGAAVYDERHYGTPYRTFFVDRQRLIRQLLEQFKLPGSARVLDIACGPGHMLQDVQSMRLRAFGIDSSPGMLQAAHQRLGPSVPLVRGDAMRLPFRGAAFDLVNCSGLIEYVPNPAPLLAEILRILKPGGCMLLSSTNLLSPATALVPLVDAARRSRRFRALLTATRVPVEEKSLTARQFAMAFHTPGGLSRQCVTAGFQDVRRHYYHLQLLPHPLDRFVPALFSWCVQATEPLLHVPVVRALAEGLLVMARRPL